MWVPVVLFLLALAVRALTAILFGDPAYPDSFYYVNVARQLAAGEGFQVDYIWSFVDVGGRLPADPGLPIPSNAHWMPLAALIQVPFIWLLGPTPLASGLPFWLAAAVASPLTYAIARDAGVERRVAIGAGILAAVPGAVSIFLGQPDNFALFMVLGAVALWACARGLRGDRRAFALGGIAVGLATLARNDGVLLGVPLALAFAAEVLGRRRPVRIGWRAALLCVAGFVLVLAPWLVRQMDVFGSISPSSSSGRILWITEYRELYSIGGDPPNIASFLAQGAGQLLASRAGGLLAALGIFALMPLLFFLAPFTVIGTWLHRRDSAFVPWIVYAVTLFAFSALLFAVHVPHGTFLHSAVALLPHAYVLAILGIVATVHKVAHRRPSWNAQRATAVFMVGAVVLGVFGGSLATASTSSRWEAERTVRRQVAATLAGLPAGERLMSPDAGSYRFHAGRPGIVTPDDPLPVVEDALRAYDIRWLVLERDHIVASLAPILAGRERPGWLSAPLMTIPPEPGIAPSGPETADARTGATDDVGPITAASLPRAALYAVCFSADDERCR